MPFSKVSTLSSRMILPTVTRQVVLRPVATEVQVIVA